MSKKTSATKMIYAQIFAMRPSSHVWLLFVAVICALLAAEPVLALVLIILLVVNRLLEGYALKARESREQANQQVAFTYREAAAYTARSAFIAVPIAVLVSIASKQMNTTTALIALAVIAAILPISLPFVTALIQENKSLWRHSKKTLLQLAGLALDSLFVGWVKLMFVGVGLIGVVAFAIPLGMSIPQLLALDLFVATPILVTLRHDKKPLIATSHWPHGKLLARETFAEAVWSGLLISILAYANFVLFFWRQGLSVEHIIFGSDIQNQAASLAFLTFTLCILLLLLQRRSPRSLFDPYQLHNKRLWPALGVVLFIVLNIIYNPLLNPLFHSGPLSLNDWLYALAAAVLFTAAYEFIQHTKHHSRKALLARHHPQAILKQLRTAKNG